MSGKLKAAAYATLVLSVSLLVLALSSRDIDASTWLGTYTLTQTSNTAFGNPDATALYNQGTGNANFGRVDNAAAPTGSYIVLDSQITDGYAVGQINSDSTLGLINAPCATPIAVPIPFMDGTTDIFNTIDQIGGGENLVADNDNDGIVEASDTNGVPNYADHYPSFLNTLFDPDGPAGAKPPIRPRARATGHAQVVDGAPPTFLNFVIFNPGDLTGNGDATRGLGLPESRLKDTFGYVIRVVLNNEAAGATPSTITDFCTPLATNTLLRGLTIGKTEVTPGPAPFEVEGSVAQCGDASGIANFLVLEDAAGPGLDPADDDADGFPNDGCLHIPDPCGGVDYDGDTTVTGADGEDPLPATDDDGNEGIDEGCGILRAENPAPNTGLYGTGTHAVHSYSSGIRDLDSDGIDNGADPCFANVDNSVDADGDGLDSACDPNDAVASAIAVAPDNVNNDGDSWPAASGPAETGTQCTGTGTPPGYDPPHLDDDGDTVINDGCGAATDEDPVNNADDDGDTRLDEDGNCPGTSGLPDQDADCFGNRGDNCPLVSNVNQADYDTGLSSADAGTAGDTIGDACDPTPPPIGSAEVACADAVDSDVDGRVNDGCPSSGVRPEAGAECENKTNDDKVTQRTLATGDDVNDDALVNDGCPRFAGGTVSGHYHSNSPVSYVCIAGTDSDSDGVCDDTEDVLGNTDLTGTPEFKGLELDDLPADNDGDTVLDLSPQVCSDFTIYPGGATVDNDLDGAFNGADTDCASRAYDPTNDEDGANACNDGLDQIGDTLIDAADPDCPPGTPGSVSEDSRFACNDKLDQPTGDTKIDKKDPDCYDNTVADADKDGIGEIPSAVVIGEDNCPANDNPEQQDTDNDGLGDDCDDNDDGDTGLDRNESYMGTDPKDNCSDDVNDPANPSDADNNANINVGDVIVLFGSGKILKLVGDPLYSARSDSDANGNVNVGDVIVLFGSGNILVRCEKNITASPAAAFTTVTVTFNTKGIVYQQSYTATDDQGGAYTETLGAGASANVLTLSARTGGGTCNSAACTITIKSNNRRVPVTTSIVFNP